MFARSAFQTSRYNSSGEYVAVTVHAGAHSKEAGQWLERSDWPFGWTESLGGAQIGNLRKPCRWLTWNVAQPESRSAVLDEVVCCIRETALPFFARFDDLRALAADLINNEVLGIWPEKAVAFCYWQLGKAAAEQCLMSWIRRYSIRLDDFRVERDRVLAGGIPEDVLGDDITRLGAIAGSLGIAKDI
jgi:hypothetical protein